MNALSIQKIEEIITAQVALLADAWDIAKERNDMQREMSLNASAIELNMLLDSLKQEANKTRATK
jgi:hypothetical protein|tara:strand:+ start:292 stop:486 length:195 start_codon:yes stop_codon:yes gene_type:complete